MVFERKLVLLAQVDGALPISKIILNSVCLWIRVYQLPLLSINDRMGKQIGNPIGVCSEVDCAVNGDLLGDYFRIRVKFDTTQPLWRRMLIHFKGQIDRWVAFSYERLPELCYKCGMVDHWTSDCSLTGIPSPGEGRPFGPWLKAVMYPFRARRFGRWRRIGKENLQFPTKFGVPVGGGSLTLGSSKRRLLEQQDLTVGEVTQTARVFEIRGEIVIRTDKNQIFQGTVIHSDKDFQIPGDIPRGTSNADLELKLNKPLVPCFPNDQSNLSNSNLTNVVISEDYTCILLGTENSDSFECSPSIKMDENIPTRRQSKVYSRGGKCNNPNSYD